MHLLLVAATYCNQYSTRSYYYYQRPAPTCDAWIDERHIVGGSLLMEWLTYQFWDWLVTQLINWTGLSSSSRAVSKPIRTSPHQKSVKFLCIHRCVNGSGAVGPLELYEISKFLWRYSTILPRFVYERATDEEIAEALVEGDRSQNTTINIAIATRMSQFCIHDVDN